jgi:acyl-ACP thioesterase
MYTFDSRVRYSETSADGRLTPEKLIDYFQDCSTFQSEDIGAGGEWIRSQGLAWMIVYWRVEIRRMPSLGEYIRIGTLPYEMKGSIGLRNFMMDTADGERLASANSVWSLINTETMHPARITAEILEKFRLEDRLDMLYDSRKIRIPDIPGEEKPPVMVKEYHLDSNRHMNNGQYVRIAMGYLPPETQISVLRIDYRRQARLGDRITPVLYGLSPDKDPMTDHTDIPGTGTASEKGSRTVCVSLNDDDGRPYAVLEIKN